VPSSNLRQSSGGLARRLLPRPRSLASPPPPTKVPACAARRAVSGSDGFRDRSSRPWRVMTQTRGQSLVPVRAGAAPNVPRVAAVSRPSAPAPRRSPAAAITLERPSAASRRGLRTVASHQRRFGTTRHNRHYRPYEHSHHHPSPTTDDRSYSPAGGPLLRFANREATLSSLRLLG
jgi:hypothetical protein